MADASSGAIRPFRIEIPEPELEDLRDRLARTRWPDELPGIGWSRGVPLAYMRELADYWRSTFDWRKQEARLNALPQFTTEIDGANVHFIHVRSKEANAVPLIMSHGWPGSVVEFLNVIGPLTDPVAHGGSAEDPFHLVCPSLPGYGFSGPVRETGWVPRRIAAAFGELMTRLGYDRFGAQGGDWGMQVSRDLGILLPNRVFAVHINQLKAIPGPDDDPASFTADVLDRLEDISSYGIEGNGYMRQQATRPQTLAYALNDSPAGLLAWIVEKFKEWTDSAESPEDAVDRDELLTNISLYWFTRTAGSSAQLYYEMFHWEGNKREDLRVMWGELEKSTVPTGVAVLPHDLFRSIRRFADRSDNIVHWTEFDRGGHFAAMEEPDLLIEDVRLFFRKFR